MSSIFGTLLKISIFGESHGEAVGMTIDGFPAGLKIDEELIAKELQKRNPKNELTTPRHEEDKVEFVSGLFNGFTTGAPLTYIIRNKDVKSSDYIKGVIRPSHADLTSYIKYNGFNDYRGGGFTSGRLTAPIVVLGTICKSILSKHNVQIGSHIAMLHGVQDLDFDFENIENELKYVKSLDFPVIDDQASVLMRQEILKAAKENDSVGGELQTAVTGLPIGLGEPFFDSVESVISHLLFSIGGVKGVHFGDAFTMAFSKGSEVNDQLSFENNDIKFHSNHNGGINGGITNGQPVIINTLFKPTSTIGKPQQTIKIDTKENIVLENKGRHDPCILYRAIPVVEALVAYALVDLLMIKESKKI